MKFKTSFIPEDYLSVKQEKHCNAMARLRISAHSHAIEGGKYTTPPTPIENRTCKHCPEDIENEYHFLIQCKTYCTDRETLYKGIEMKCLQFKSLDNKSKLMYMLSAGVEIAQLVAKIYL